MTLYQFRALPLGIHTTNMQMRKSALQQVKQASSRCQCIVPRNGSLRESRRLYASNAAAPIQPRQHASYIRPFLSNQGPRNCTNGIPRRTYASISAAELQFGQPVHETHPHLLRAGERMYYISTSYKSAALTDCYHSYARNNCARICGSTSETCCEPSKRWHSNTCFCRHQVPFGSGFLRVPPRTQFPIPDRIQ